MSCSRDAEHCEQIARAHGAPESVAVWAAGRGAGGHCERCGGFLTAEGVCNNPRCGMLAMTLDDTDPDVQRIVDAIAERQDYAMPENAGCPEGILMQAADTVDNMPTELHGNRRVPDVYQQCPQCGAALRQGVCQNNRCGWIASLQQAREFIRQITDHELLEHLARSRNDTVRAAVAGNPHTPPPTVFMLAADSSDAVYHAAIQNPALLTDGLQSITDKVREQWKSSWQQIIQFALVSLSSSARRRTGGLLGGNITSILLFGAYGIRAFGLYKRYHNARAELRRRVMLTGDGIGMSNRTVSTVSPVMSSALPTSVADKFNLTPEEQDLFSDGLDIAESYCELGADAVGEIVWTPDDVIRIREAGPSTDGDRQLLSSVLDEMEVAEKSLPGFFNILPDTFRSLRNKLGC